MLITLIPIYWGGSSNWTKIEGRIVIGADSTYKVGNTGGSATHTLTVNQLPAHNHNVYVDVDYSAFSTGNNNSWKQMLVNVDGNMDVNCDKTNYTGSGQSVNHMPPYIALYIWERVS